MTLIFLLSKCPTFQQAILTVSGQLG